MAVTTSSKLLRMRTISAASIAIFVPAPMAMPTSAAAKACESFTPSPTIATIFPVVCVQLSTKD